jgi:hypothetical protein
VKGDERAQVVLTPLATPLPLTFVGLLPASLILSGLDLGWVPASETRLAGWVDRHADGDRHRRPRHRSRRVLRGVRARARGQFDRRHAPADVPEESAQALIALLDTQVEVLENEPGVRKNL